jgi:hypothetical protein
MYDATEVDAHEAEKTEIKLDVTVFFHADRLDEAEVRERVAAIKHVVEEALADEENDIRGFTYPAVETRIQS